MPQTQFKGILINGSKLFIAQTKKAFTLLEKYNKLHYVIKYITIINQHETDVGLIPEFGYFDVLDVWVGPEETLWYASVLIHEAKHCHLFYNKRKTQPKGKISQKIYAGRIAEDKCLNAQINFFNKFNTIKAYKFAKHCQKGKSQDWWTNSTKKELYGK